MDIVNPELRPALRQVSQFLSGLTYNDASLELGRQFTATWNGAIPKAFTKA